MFDFSNPFHPSLSELSGEVSHLDASHLEVSHLEVSHAARQPSDTLPPLTLEVAAQEEEYLRRRDAEIAQCFGLSATHVTHKRHTNRASWDAFEVRWFTEGPAIYAATQQRLAAREQARQQRVPEAEGAGFPWVPLPAARCAHLPPAGKPAFLARLGSTVFDRTCQDRVMVPALLLIAVYLAVGVLAPGFWTALWNDLMGVPQ